MRNPILEHVILKILFRQSEPVHFWAFSNSVSFEMDDAELTTEEFRDALRIVEDRGLIKREKDLLGYTVWSITKLGKEAAKHKASPTRPSEIPSIENTNLLRKKK